MKALALDANLADAYFSLGPPPFFYEWDWSAAEKSYKRAFELNPNNALAHDLYSLYLQSQNRADEAVVEAKRALELDPLSSYLNWGLRFGFL